VKWPLPSAGDDYDRISVAGTVNPHDATTYRRQRGGCLRRTIQIQAGDHLITAADPLPDDLRQAIEAINASR
jgi:hypothetical protein